MSMRRLIGLAAALFLWSAPAFSQAPQLGAGQVYGNSTAAQRPARAENVTDILDRALGSTRGAIIERGASGWAIVPPGTAGLAWVSAGAGADPLYGIVGLNGGGCNAALTASNGGILYSTATACAVLPATATARQMLQSGASAAPAWSTATWPATTTINQILYSSSTNVVAGLASANSAILVTDGSGVPLLSRTIPGGVFSAGVYNPLSPTYGAVCDGVTDDAVALQAAATAASNAAAAGPGVVFEISAACATSATVILSAKDNMEIRFVQGGKINVIGSAASVRGFHVYGGTGPSGAPTTITVNANYGTRELTVASAAGMAAGDTIQIFNALGYVPQPTYGRGMVNQIMTVVGNVLTLVQPLAWDIDTANTTSVQKYVPAKNVTITNVNVDGSSYTGSGGIGFLYQYLSNSTISNSYASNFNAVNGQGITGYNLWASSVSNSLTYNSGDTSSNAQDLWYVTNTKLNNIRSYKSTGFGVSLSYVSGNTASDIVSEYSVGRGVKLYGSCDNMIDRIRGNYAQGTLVGVAFTVGSSNNRVNHVETLYNGTSGLWFNGLDNSNNTVNDVMSFGNGTYDIWVAATAPFTDDFNRITGVDPLAIHTLIDVGNTGNVIQYVPDADSTHFLRSDGVQTNALTGPFIGTSFSANGTANAPSYNSVNIGNFGGLASGKAYIGDNIYWDQTGGTYRTNITNAGVGYSLIELGLNGALNWAGASGATTAGAAVTPTLVAIVKQGDTMSLPLGSISTAALNFGTVDTGLYSASAAAINMTVGGVGSQQFTASSFTQYRSGGAPNITAQRTDAHGTSQTVGTFVFRGMNDAAASAIYSQFQAVATDVTAGAQAGYMSFTSVFGGANKVVARATGTASVHEFTPDTTLGSNLGSSSLSWNAVYSHKYTGQGSAPALTSCGTSPAITGTDFAGTVTMGTGSPAGCTITFASAFTSTPHCTVTWQANIASMQYTLSTTAITLVQTATSSNKVNYVCAGI